MSDRFGPSEDCDVCGHTYSVIEIEMCGLCYQNMCRHCIQNHVCETPEQKNSELLKE